MAKTFKTRFLDVNLFQDSFSPTSVSAVKEIFAAKNNVLPHNVRNLDFRKCLRSLQIDKTRELYKKAKQSYFLSTNGNVIN